MRHSYAGYFGALAALLCGVAIPYIFPHQSPDSFSQDAIYLLFGAAFCVFGVMLFFELRFIKKTEGKIIHKAQASRAKLAKSALVRFNALLFCLLIMYIIVQLAPHYAISKMFIPSREFFDLVLILYLVLGFPYLYLTLRYKSGTRYEFNDYAILLLIFYKSLFKIIAAGSSEKVRKTYATRIFNRRVIKALLAFVISFFFLTLMTRFLHLEYTELSKALSFIQSPLFEKISFYHQYNVSYTYLYHLIIFVDVIIAMVGYTVSTRWLGNRSKSVDMTFFGWIVVLMCYPPFNELIESQISINDFDTHPLTLSDIANMAIMTLILILFTLYAWATAALGFKFSNLSNRGIISHGPYAFVRHPAYACKNLAWWLQATFVLTNIWASLLLLAWNIVYILRGITEEHHLMKDREYQAYCKRVKHRFIPKII